MRNAGILIKCFFSTGTSRRSLSPINYYCWTDIDEARMISVYFSTSQNTSPNSISNFFEKNINFGGFPWSSTREDLSIDVSITNVGLILTKIGLISILGVRTDRQDFGETCRHTKNFNSKFKIRN